MRSDLGRRCAAAVRAAAFLAACAAPVWAADDVPQWLSEAARVAVPSYPAKVTSVVLLNEEHTIAGTDGKLTTTTRTAIKVLATQGTGIFFYDQYETSGGKVRDFRAWMIPPSGKVKKYGKGEILDIACADNDVYNECRRRMVSGKADAVAGAVFAYESVVERVSFSNQLLFYFQDAAPVRQARFKVTVPAGWEIKSSSFNGAPAESAAAGGTYTWQMENLGSVEPEPAAPSYGSVVPWVGVNLIAPSGKRPPLTWADAAKLLSELNEGQGEATEAIAAKARSLVEGATTELDKIRAIAKFTQQVNYVSIQVNTSKGGGYRPHAASQVFQKLYGDCKDKANLTRAMLQAVGITALPVAIYSGDRTHVNREWPSLGAFNHAISAIRVSADTKAPAVLEHPKLGRLLFFDPTDPHVPAGHIPDHEQGSHALIGAADGGGLVAVPAAPPVPAEHRREVEAELNGEGAISGSFVERRSGEQIASAVGAFRSAGKTDYIRMIERWVGRGIAGATTSGVEADDSGGGFVLKGKFSSQTFAQRPQRDMLIFKAGLLPHGELRFTEKTRKYPVVIDAEALEETARIKLPAGFKVDEIPAPVKLASPFGKFEANWRVESGTLVFTRTFEMGAQTVAAARYAELRRFLDTVAGSAGMPVVLVR